MSENKKKEPIPWEGLLLMIAIVATAIFFWTTTDHSRKKGYSERLKKEFPNSQIIQWSEFEFTVFQKVTNISKKITFDKKGNEKVDDPIEIIEE